MILTFVERLGKVTNICKDRGQAYTRNALSLDKCGVFWQDGVSSATTSFNISPVEEAVPVNTPPPPIFSHVIQWISFARDLASSTKWCAGAWGIHSPAWGALSSASSPAEPRPAPQLGAAEQCCSRPTSPSSHRATICGQAGCGYAAREATVLQTSHANGWSGMVRKSAGRHSQLITVLSRVSTACDGSEKCSCVCVTLPTWEALLVQQ